MRFTTEQIKDLAAEERRMDSGVSMFVITNGQRRSVRKEVMEELGLVNGQTASSTIVIRISELELAMIRSEIAIDKACAGIAKRVRFAKLAAKSFRGLK